jgi:hypothetical protein
VLIPNPLCAIVPVPTWKEANFARIALDALCGRPFLRPEQDSPVPGFIVEGSNARVEFDFA